MTPVLSILVPTFNRMADLARLMPRLLEVLDLHPEVDLVISNNASTDGTAAFLDSLPRRERLVIVHQPINYGPNIHLAWLYGQAKGQFLWMFCDDDVFDLRVVRRILDAVVANRNLAWIHLPHTYVGSFPDGARPSDSPSRDVMYPSAQAAIVDFAQYSTFISSNVIRTSLLAAHIGKLKFDHSFWPWSLLVRSVCPFPAMVFSGRWIVAGPDISWKDSWVEIANIQHPRAILEDQVLSLAERKACMRMIFKTEPDRLERLIAIRPLFLLKLLLFEPRLIAGFFRLRVAKKILKPDVWKRLLLVLSGKRRFTSGSGRKSC